MTPDEQTAAMCKRIESLETKVDKLITLFERASGAYRFAKWVGSLVLGLAAVWGFLATNFRLK